MQKRTQEMERGMTDIKGDVMREALERDSTQYGNDNEAEAFELGFSKGWKAAAKHYTTATLIEAVEELKTYHKSGNQKPLPYVMAIDDCLDLIRQHTSPADRYNTGIKQVNTIPMAVRDGREVERLLNDYHELCKFNAETNECGNGEAWAKKAAKLESVLSPSAASAPVDEAAVREEIYGAIYRTHNGELRNIDEVTDSVMDCVRPYLHPPAEGDKGDGGKS